MIHNKNMNETPKMTKETSSTSELALTACDELHKKYTKLDKQQSQFCNNFYVMTRKVADMSEKMKMIDTSKITSEIDELKSKYEELNKKHEKLLKECAEHYNILHVINCRITTLFENTNKN
jgi:predicted  nucleic acid-binding Zn-ribbon protein